MKPEDLYKELRFGNWVNAHAKYGIEPVQVESIHHDEIGHTATFNDGNCNDPVSAIPLTKEWLLRFEDFKTDSIHIDNETDLQILFKDDKIEVELIGSNYGQDILLRDIEHVHQLQNLYYDLKGEELTEVK